MHSNSRNSSELQRSDMPTSKQEAAGKGKHPDEALNRSADLGALVVVVCNESQRLASLQSSELVFVGFGNQLILAQQFAQMFAVDLRLA